MLELDVLDLGEGHDGDSAWLGKGSHNWLGGNESLVLLVLATREAVPVVVEAGAGTLAGGNAVVERLLAIVVIMLELDVLDLDLGEGHDGDSAWLGKGSHNWLGGNESLVLLVLAT